jgi:1,2-diacylglycerol 3-beta-glucosyltransferase
MSVGSVALRSPPVAVFVFDGLPVGWQVFFGLALVVVALMFAWSTVLFLRSGRAERRAPAPTANGTDAFTWVFLVPALNEELTIRDSVSRLLAIPVAHRCIIVIDDASDDATAAVLASIESPDLVVLHRSLPDARRGKAAALNFAYRSLGAHLAKELGTDPREHVIVVVVDADGRLHASAPGFAAAHFTDPSVGGVQSRVRIYNRGQLLTWLQDLEFGIYAHLFQSGRNDWGTAGMGGNGQFNRLRALDDIAGEAGPWRDRLTEDQDLGLRLMTRGWQGRQDVRATVDQQGLARLRPLLRQRTRWAQGNLQALALVRPLWRAPIELGARVELVAYLLMPLWQGIVGAATVSALVLAALGVAPFWGGGPTWQLLVVYLLGFGGTVLGCIAARRHDGPRGWIEGFVVGHAYALYTWTIWPVLVRATARQLMGRGTWAKTHRVPIDGADPIRPT